jgi:Tfp pilus assembly protein PilV
MPYQSNKHQYEFGQTLIETLVGIFILVIGIFSAVSLAVFSYSGSKGAVKKIIAIGLAREGVEAVKNMRDTNWLRQDTLDTNCYNPKGAQNNAKCYKAWLGTSNNSLPYCLDPTDNNGNCNGNGAITQNYNLGMNVGINDIWVLDRQRNKDNYGIDFNSDIASVNFKGFYAPSNSTQGNSEFFRKIILTEDDGTASYGSGANNPFNKNTGPRLKVVSQVWWTDRQCPVALNWPGLGKCSVELQTYLTNWKDY